MEDVYANPARGWRRHHCAEQGLTASCCIILSVVSMFNHRRSHSQDLKRPVELIKEESVRLQCAEMLMMESGSAMPAMGPSSAGSSSRPAASAISATLV